MPPHNTRVFRYHKQSLFQQIGEIGQHKIVNASALIVGCGALGSAQAELLARAGLGRIVLLDRDIVEWSNLQRQQLYDEAQVQAGMPKAIAAKDRLRQINSQITIETHVVDLDYSNILPLVESVDLVLDGTDNFETRFLLNDACLHTKTPWFHGACVGSYGTTMTIVPEQTACFRCLYPTPPAAEALPTCDTVGVLGTIVTSIAALQVTEVLKWLVGATAEMRWGLWQYELWQHPALDAIGFTKARTQCPACQLQQFDYLSGKRRQQSTVLCGRNTVQICPSRPQRLDLATLATQFQALGEVTQNDFLLRLQVAPHTLTLFPDGRALITGTADPVIARSLYAKWIGT